jgi:small multidrug resistance pump
MPVHYIALFAAIIAETIGTSALQASQQFTRLWSIALKAMPVGVVYAIWSGLGIVLIAIAGFVIFGQKLDLAAIIGLGLIIAGVTVLHVFSGTTPH